MGRRKILGLMDVEPNPILPAPLRSQSLPRSQRGFWLTAMTSYSFPDNACLRKPYCRCLRLDPIHPRSKKGIPLSLAEKLAGLTSDCQDIMNRVVRTATRLVTNDDELVISLDGINIILELETQDRIDPDYMWFRIVSTDRYLSLRLGLPQGSYENVFASQKVLQNCIAVEHLERLESVAAGLILQRNVGEQIDLATTHEVDKMLQEAAALMPPRWWLMTSNGAVGSDDAQAFKESIRLTNHLTYRHLLVWLHVPYMMLSSSTEPRYDYSRMTAANASRAIVAQFVAFRGANLSTAYCRGIDFVAFIASRTLCIAHMEAHRQHQFGYGKDVTISIILRSLLAIENDSANGAWYRTTATLELYKEDPHSFGARDDNLNELHINIPYFGTIKFEHSPTHHFYDRTDKNSLRRAISKRVHPANN
ncbi:C6 zinc finger domain-containing protein [Paracoccidioides lutzii Pb01]|uniref:C6 zinc finger domain-containing protein n=1 Tax=Paracoccidioides lutzii (strain ATCC MYA-826 / Pb01) TaxID=502779 RepID=C1HCY6_PARBA|nr:C6 zinc finger domain-containing protein [Paracoccidioides lutzii Pb01]EEH39358.2 C6 zinc finger domain-containing protein [Paracoccidioides lutzii Pb01]